MLTDHAVHLGILTTSTSDLLLDQVRYLEFDFIALDAELGTVSVGDCANLVRKAAGTQTWVAVRLPDNTPATVAAFSNTGVDEVILPMVRTPADVDRAWAAMTYPPRGGRQRQPSLSSRYGTDWSEPALSIVVETVDALGFVNQMATDDRIGALWLGRNDLSQDLTVTSSNLTLEEASAQVVSVAAPRGKLGVPSSTLTGLKEGFELGASRGALYWDYYLQSVLSDILRTRCAESGTSP